jgi:hypothetical protein
MEGTKPQRKRINRVFKSLHKPLTYLGIERTRCKKHYDCSQGKAAIHTSESRANGHSRRD